MASIETIFSYALRYDFVGQVRAKLMESVRFGSRSEVGRALGGELVAGGGGGARWGAKRHLQELKEIQRGLKVVRACEIEPL